ncbi:MAG: hypothetical protein GWN31_04235 [Candidatus Thorarchaeota archaeon]|nr:hypothetical protein [Candidatus Thorarchaeota archaeon]
MIEEIVTEEEEEANVNAEMEAIIAEEKAKIEDEMQEQVEPEPEEPKELSAHEREQQRLEQMKRLSSCEHPEHKIYYSESLTGRSKKPVRRYFPVCNQCGLKERFVKADSLPDEVKEAADMWTDTTSDEIKEKFLNG